MRASTTKNALGIRGDLRNILLNKKKQQEYSLNKDYEQFQTTYTKDFNDIKITLTEEDFSPNRL